MAAEAGLIQITKDQFTVIVAAVLAAIVLWNYYGYKKDKLRNYNVVPSCETAQTVRNEKDALRPTIE